MIRVLLVENEPDITRRIIDLYEQSPNKSYKITAVNNAEDALILLAKRKTFDAVIIDEQLSDTQGINTVRNFRNAAPYLPLIILGENYNAPLLSQVMKLGAQDFLIKSELKSQGLRRSTRYAIERQKAQNLLLHEVEGAGRIKEKAELLNQQKRQLIELNKAKDDFISLSSHQSRTPATSVKQYLGLMLEGHVGKVPKNLQVFMRTAYDSNERQLTIINDLLKAAQVTSADYALRKQKTDICELIRSVIIDYAPIIRLRKQKIMFHDPGLCEARIDSGEIRLVLANLLENASKYSPEETTITVSAEYHKNTVRICVIDQGVGIPSTEIKKIFDKFIRVDNELSDTVSGSGLGLYFVRRIVRLHGGRVRVESQLGMGSTFMVTLPV